MKQYVRLSEIKKSNQEMHQQIPVEHLPLWRSWASGAIVFKLETMLLETLGLRRIESSKPYGPQEMGHISESYRILHAMLDEANEQVFGRCALWFWKAGCALGRGSREREGLEWALKDE